MLCDCWSLGSTDSEFVPVVGAFVFVDWDTPSPLPGAFTLCVALGAKMPALPSAPLAGVNVSPFNTNNTRATTNSMVVETRTRPPIVNIFSQPFSLRSSLGLSCSSSFFLSWSGTAGSFVVSRPRSVCDSASWGGTTLSGDNTPSGACRSRTSRS